MAYEDWITYTQGTAETTVQTTTVYEGNASLEIDATASSRDAAFEVWEQSTTDAPTEARIDSYFNVSNKGVGGIFRYQDTANYYVLSWQPLDANMLYLFKYDGDANSNTDVDFADVNHDPTGWTPIRFTHWEDGGSLYFRVEHDEDEDGNWTQIGEDLIDNNVAHPGGGVGIGIGGDDGYPFHVFADQTEVYY